MDIGILYICTGKYKIFWNRFYQSCEEKFLKNHRKHYFVFTDATDLTYGDNVTVISESSKGFPMDSLLRFKMFDSISDQLAKFDYLFFFNSNMFINKEINEDILPTGEEELIGLIHPGYFNTNYKFFPYERNPKSTAFIPYKSGATYDYFMGSLNGGKGNAYLKLIKTLNDNVNKDLDSNFIALYHDESHLNRYYHFAKVKKLEPSYGFPEDSSIPYDQKIIILDKIKHGGGYFDKLPKKSIMARLKVKLRSIKNAIIWKSY